MVPSIVYAIGGTFDFYFSNIIFSRNKTMRYFDFGKVNWDAVVYLIQKISDSQEGVYNINYFFQKI